MSPDYLWPLVVLIIGFSLVGSLTHYLKGRLRILASAEGVDELDQRERAVKVKLAEDTLAERTEVEQARLARLAKELDIQNAVASALEDAQVEAARRKLEADTAVKVALAEEFARAEHRARIERENSTKSVVEQYDQYLKVMAGNGRNPVNFAVFNDALRQHDEDCS